MLVLIIVPITGAVKQMASNSSGFKQPFCYAYRFHGSGLQAEHSRDGLCLGLQVRRSLDGLGLDHVEAPSFPCLAPGLG